MFVDLQDPSLFVLIRILTSSSNSKKNLDSYCFVTTSWLFKELASWKSLTKWTGPGTVPKCHGSTTTQHNTNSESGSTSYKIWATSHEKTKIPDSNQCYGSGSHIFESLLTIFLAKKFYNSLKIGPNFFLQHLKTKIICNFVIFVAT